MKGARLAAIRVVQNGIAVRRLATTFMLEVSFTHRSPAMAALLANAIADSYLNEVHEAKYLATQRSTTWLMERAAALGQQVQSAERAVADHRARHGLLSTRPASLTEQQAGEINTQLVTARAQSVERKAKYEQARGFLDVGRIESMTEAMSSPVILSLRNSEATVAREEADLLTRYGPEHPSIVKMRAQRTDLRRQISVELNRIVGSLKTDYDLALARERSLERSLTEMQTDSQPVIRLRELEREVNASKALYEALLARSKEAEQQSGAPTAESRVIAPALAPTVPSSPNRSGVLMLALFGGLGAGIALAFLLDHIESGLLTIEQTEQALKLPVLSIVQELAAKDRPSLEGEPMPIPEIVWRKPLSRFGEAIRTVRVSTQMSDIDNPPRLILVTSALPSEGKSMMVQSLAYSAATSGRVLLMDCDLRHPSTTHAFKLDKNPGLTDLLSGRAQPQDVLVAGPLANLTILPAGSTAHHPPDILGSEKLASLLQIVRNEYDLVLIDAPPVTPVIDAPLLAKRVDKIVFVVRWRTTPQEIVMRALATLDIGRQKIAGVVLNAVQLQKMSGYSKNYVYYKNSYDKYYQE
jgi:capsular exopolysaccharide synthesis family protein